MHHQTAFLIVILLTVLSTGCVDVPDKIEIGTPDLPETADNFDPAAIKELYRDNKKLRDENERLRNQIEKQRGDRVEGNTVVPYQPAPEVKAVYEVALERNNLDSRSTRDFFDTRENIRARVTFLGVRKEDLDFVRATVRANRSGSDKSRSKEFRHNQIIEVNCKDADQRALFIGRVNYPPYDTQAGKQAFFDQNPNARIRVEVLEGNSKEVK